MATVRTRKDAAKLPTWDPILLWYANAIEKMQQRPLNDPTSWRYQAAIHEYIRDEDPLGQPTDQLPSSGDQDQFWNRCQHGSWFFLPWHRMYLAYFEQIIAGIVEDEGGPNDWALPYWNYSDTTNPNARKLPQAFREPKLPDGRDNPLFVAARSTAANGPNEMAIDSQVNIRRCLEKPLFTVNDPNHGADFGGPVTVFHHDGGRVGALEGTPHGSMHMAVGGWMGGFNTAGLDPIFWLHHCNVDRLWVVWRKRNTTHLDPTQSGWLSDLPFWFHDASRTEVSHTSNQVVDTTSTPPHGYQYDDVADPFPPTDEAAPEEIRRIAMDEEQVPERVGATEEPVRLTGSTARTSIPVSEPAGPAAREALGRGEPPRVYLNIENVTGVRARTSYEVYLNLPEGDEPTAHEELNAGLLPMFGVAEASRADDEHGGSGLHYVLDVTEVVRTLEQRADWNPENLDVSFVPVGIDTEGSRLTEIDDAGEVEVGQVSLYYA